MINYADLNDQQKEGIKTLIIELSDEMSTRDIAKHLLQEEGISIGKTTVHKIISLERISELGDDVTEQTTEYDDENLYVYTKKINQYGEPIKVKHKIPFVLVNELQKSYTIYGKNRTQQQIIDNNWGDEDNHIYIKDAVWNAIKKAISLNKYSGIANETFLKVLEDKYGEEAVDEYVEELAYEVTKSRYKDIEEKKLDGAFKKQYEAILKTDARMDVYLDKLSDAVKKYTPPIRGFKPTTISYDDHLIVAFGDMHVGRTTEQLEDNLASMVSYLISTPYKNISLINVGDNLESPMLQGMHVSQILDMDHRGFDQVIKAASILERLLLSLKEAGKNVEMMGMSGNHCFLKKENPLFLTEQGFKTFDEVKEGNLKLGQIKDGKTFFGNYEEIIEGNQKGTYCRFGKSQVDNRDFTVTDGHKFILDGDKFEAKEVERFESTSFTDIGGDYNFDKYDIASLMTIFDGSVVVYNTSSYYHKRNTGITGEELAREELKKKTRIQFKISKPEKIEWIEETLTDLGIHYTKQLCKKSGGNILQPHYIRIYSDDAKEIARRIGTEKKVPIEWYSLNEESKNIVKEIISKTDGTLRGNNLRMYNTDLDLIYWIQCIFKSNSIYENRRDGFPNAKKSFEITTSYDGTLSKTFTKKETYFGEEEICDFQTETGTLIVSVGMNTFVHSNCRGNKNPADDPELLPGLAVYEIVRSRLEGIVPVKYFKDNVNTFTLSQYNIILSHGDQGFATKNSDQIVSLKGSPMYYSLIINGHLHTPRIEQGSGWTRFQTPSVNIGDRYSDQIIMKESLPGFVTVQTLNNYPLISFIPC